MTCNTIVIPLTGNELQLSFEFESNLDACSPDGLVCYIADGSQIADGTIEAC